MYIANVFPLQRAGSSFLKELSDHCKSGVFIAIFNFAAYAIQLTSLPIGSILLNKNDLRLIF
jgi:hypothetical protein